MTDNNDQFKFGDQALISEIINKNKLIYDGFTIKVGHKNCECSAFRFKIRDSFKCTTCAAFHHLKCSKQSESSIIANEYFQCGDNFCVKCSTKN